MDVQERQLVIENIAVRLTSYRLGERYAARVDNVDPGGTVGRGRGATREEAEASAINGASVRFGLSAGRESLRNSVAQLPRSGNGSKE